MQPLADGRLRYRLAVAEPRFPVRLELGARQILQQTGQIQQPGIAPRFVQLRKLVEPRRVRDAQGYTGKPSDHIILKCGSTILDFLGRFNQI